jgi:nucleotide-binding universal stress UspA family protein
MTDNQFRAAARGRVVAGVDGSPNSLAALRHAVHQARCRGACVELVYVVPPNARPGAQIIGFSRLEMSVRCQFPRGCDVPLRYTVERGDPAEILVKRSTSAELLVIGGRCHPGHGGLLGGEVVPYCLGRAVCPVDICGGRLTPRRATRGTRARATVKAGRS